MAASKQSNKKKQNDLLVKSDDQVMFFFKTMYTAEKEESLSDGILLWLSKMEQHHSFRLFLSLPELMEQHGYGLIDFLEGRVDIPEVADRYTFRLVGIAAYLFTLTTACWSLLGEKIIANPDAPWPDVDTDDIDYKTIKMTLKAVNYFDVRREFAQSVMSIVGEQYHELFQSKLKTFDNRINSIEAKLFENDPALKKHMQLMIWFGLVRCFMDAVYYYFIKREDSNVK